MQKFPPPVYTSTSKTSLPYCKNMRFPIHPDRKTPFHPNCFHRYPLYYFLVPPVCPAGNLLRFLHDDNCTGQNSMHRSLPGSLVYPLLPVLPEQPVTLLPGFLPSEVPQTEPPDPPPGFP